MSADQVQLTVVYYFWDILYSRQGRNQDFELGEAKLSIYWQTILLPPLYHVSHSTFLPIFRQSNGTKCVGEGIQFIVRFNTCVGEKVQFIVKCDNIYRREFNYAKKKKDTKNKNGTFEMT